ncbi:MAG: hypothetical protein QGD88_10075 [Anaerolineae bacterium]|nr:hypothetical protein [Anaerolineae bacterium]
MMVEIVDNRIHLDEEPDMRKFFFILISMVLLSPIACSPLPFLATPTPTPSATATPTITASPTLTPTQTETPPPTATFTVPFTPTPEKPAVTGTRNTFCRWGPGTVYRSIGFDFLEEGDIAIAEGRDYDDTWYWVVLEGFSFHCWVSASIVEVNFEPKSLPYVPVNVPTNNQVPSPKGVSAARNGNQVVVSWGAAPAAPELEYLIEATLCFNGFQADLAYSTTNTSMSLPDDTNCSQKSFGRMYVVNKEGYSNPVNIPWP